MAETRIIVEPGTIITFPNAQTLEVSEASAVGRGGELFCTAGWAQSADAERASWEGRSWVRKALSLPPKGYWNNHQRAAPLFGGVFSIF